MVNKQKGGFGAHNMAGSDRVIRVILGVIFVALALLYGGLLYIILGVLGVVFILTSAVNSCPIYSALGISTKK
jgi:uncharacterized membrane protein